MQKPLLPANEGINLIMKNKTILITGGTTGIGLATAKLLSAEGAKIIVTGRNSETLAAVQRELPGVIVIKSDSGSLSAAQRSEEHTSELQSQSNLVCRLLLEKKKT